MGINYGPAYRGLQEMYIGKGQVLARISLPDVVSNTLNQFHLHPCLIDSALHASIGFSVSEILKLGDEADPSSLADGSQKAFVPFALQEAEIFGPCETQMWSLVRYSDHMGANRKVQKVDIDICDGQGSVRVRLKGFSSRIMDDNPKSPAKPKPQAKAAATSTSAQSEDLTILLSPVTDPVLETIEQRLGGPLEEGPECPRAEMIW